MSDDTGRSGNPAQQEQEMREHEREAREREGAERSPAERAAGEAGGVPAPPGTIQHGGISS